MSAPTVRDDVVATIQRMVRDAGAVTREVRTFFEASRISGAAYRDAVTRGLKDHRRLCAPGARVLVIVLEAGGAVTVCRSCSSRIALDARASGSPAPEGEVCQDPDHQDIPDEEAERLLAVLEGWPRRR